MTAFHLRRKITTSVYSRRYIIHNFKDNNEYNNYQRGENYKFDFLVDQLKSSDRSNDFRSKGGWGQWKTDQSGSYLILELK